MCKNPKELMEMYRKDNTVKVDDAMFYSKEEYEKLQRQNADLQYQLAEKDKIIAEKNKQLANLKDVIVKMELERFK